MFSKSTYLIKEHAAVFKLSDTYDIIDPESGQVVAQAKENISGWMKALRLLIKKALLPTKIEIKSVDTQAILYTLKKKPGFFRTKVLILDQDGQDMGFFQSKFLSWGGGFHVYGPDGASIAEVKGSWTGWDFRFLDDQKKELGQVTKKWAGIGKELFTTADNYVVSVSPSISGNTGMVSLLIIAGLAIDVVFKEKK